MYWGVARMLKHLVGVDHAAYQLSPAYRSITSDQPASHNHCAGAILMPMSFLRRLSAVRRKLASFCKKNNRATAQTQNHPTCVHQLPATSTHPQPN